MKFSEILRQSGRGCLDEMIAHPFNQELAAGRLPLAKFTEYLQQDELYIKEYTRALWNLFGKAPGSDFAGWIKRFAEDGYELEKALHDQFFGRYKIEPVSKMNQACQEYTSYLLMITASGNFAEGITALLPCFYDYYEVGKALLEKSNQANPYQSWLSTYADATFGEQVEQMQIMVDESARGLNEEEKENLIQIYLRSSRLELNFWTAAYNRNFPGG